MTKRQIFKALLVALFLFIILVIGICILVSNSNKTEEMEINPVDEFGEYTYKFKGKTEHYKFDNGLVWFEDDYSKIEISDFKRIQKIEGLISEEITIYFNDKMVFVDENKKALNKSSFSFDTTFYEAGEICTDKSQFKGDSFFETNKDTFKESIKVVVEYCTKKKCTKETFEIEYE